MQELLWVCVNSDYQSQQFQVDWYNTIPLLGVAGDSSLVSTNLKNVNWLSMASLPVLILWNTQFAHLILITPICCLNWSRLLSLPANSALSPQLTSTEDVISLNKVYFQGFIPQTLLTLIWKCVYFSHYIPWIFWDSAGFFQYHRRCSPCHKSCAHYMKPKKSN